MRLLVAMDKFKGSLTAAAAGAAVCRGLQRVFPDDEIDVCPIADGGEGTADAVVAALGGRRVDLLAHDAHGREIRTHYGLVERGGCCEAVMEMSATSGLVQVNDLPLNPAAASSYGTGEMIRDALFRKVGRIIIGIGGSATNDGGMGMALALGHRFLDAHGMPVETLPREFERVRSIARSPLALCEMLVACDVRNPLLGDQGATRVYGPQKGVRDVAFFETRMKKLAEIVARDFGVDYRDIPGAGAAGGLGFGLMSFCGARLVSGFDLVASLIGLAERVALADIVITGEGKIDRQTLNGKGPAGVARMARTTGKKVVALAGVLERSPELIRSFDLLLQSKPNLMSIDEAIKAGGAMLEEKIVESADVLRALAASQSQSIAITNS